MAQGKRRDSQREAGWREVLARHGSSGLSVRAFCRREGLPQSAFYAWRRILQQRDTQRKRVEDGPRPAFLPLRVRADDERNEDGDAHITIDLRGGRVMRLPLSIAPARLAAVLRVIEEAA